MKRSLPFLCLPLFAGLAAAVAQGGRVIGITASSHSSPQSGFQFTAPHTAATGGSLVAIPLPIGYRVRYLADDGSVLLEFRDPEHPGQRLYRRWQAGNVSEILPTVPRTDWRPLPVMNRKGDVGATWSGPNGELNRGILARSGAVIEVAPIQASAAEFRSLSNTHVAGEDGMALGSNFNPDRQDYDYFYYMAGSVWGLAGGRIEVGPRGAMGQRAPHFPFRVNDRGDYLAEHMVEIDGIWYYNTDSYNGTELPFAATALNNAGVVVGWDFETDRPCRWQAGVVTEISPRIGTPVAISDFGEILINHDDGTVVLWRPISGAPGGYVPTDLTSLVPEVINLRGVALRDDGAVLFNASNASGEDRAWLLLPAALRTDLDRNGAIARSSADTPTRANPFRFWANDDDDEGDEKRSARDDFPLPSSHRRRNAENRNIDGVRDLEDFFPVHLDLWPLLTVLPPETPGVRYRLRHADSSLGIVFTTLAPEKPLEYLHGKVPDLATGFGPALDREIGDAPVHRVTAEGLDLFSAANGSPAFLARLRAGSGGILLVEATQPTSSPLILEVTSGADIVARLSFELEIAEAKAMIRFHNLRAAAHGTPIKPANQGPRFAEPGPGEAPADPFAALPSRTNFVWVHGYNVSAPAAVGTALTVFKRMYWAGSTAKFHAVLWRGDDGQFSAFGRDFVTPDYPRNVGHAWQQGMLFRDFLLSLPEPTTIAAHSLGNAVTMVALTRERDPADPARLRKTRKPPGVTRYFAIDAAVPLEALSANDITAESQSRMRHKYWRDYDQQTRLWPTHWHLLFAGTEDHRRHLTWQNVFGTLEVGTNLYSSGEEVLGNPIDDSTPFWAPIFKGGTRAWVTQEKHKGGAGPAAVLQRSNSGGWALNPYWTTDPSDYRSPKRYRSRSEVADRELPAGVPSAALVANPFFRPFQATETGPFYPGYNGSDLHREIGDPAGSAEAAKLVTIAKILGEAMPVLSYAMGANRSDKIPNSENFDLNAPGFSQGFPQKRQSPKWLHSDCVDLPYIYNRALFELLVKHREPS